MEDFSNNQRRCYILAELQLMGPYIDQSQLELRNILFLTP
jgi:hypothetical protein